MKMTHYDFKILEFMFSDKKSLLKMLYLNNEH